MERNLPSWPVNPGAEAGDPPLFLLSLFTNLPDLSRAGEIAGKLTRIIVVIMIAIMRL